MAKVQCKFCKLEKESCCIKKGVSVKLNKHRHCDFYKLDETKIDNYVERKLNTSKPEVFLRPDGWWDKKGKKVVVKTITEEDFSNYGTTANIPITNTEHPLTGDLSRFVQSTVEDTNE